MMLGLLRLIPWIYFQTYWSIYGRLKFFFFWQLENENLKFSWVILWEVEKKNKVYLSVGFRNRPSIGGISTCLFVPLNCWFDTAIIISTKVNKIQYEFCWKYYCEWCDSVRLFPCGRRSYDRTTLTLFDSAFSSLYPLNIYCSLFYKSYH